MKFLILHQCDVYYQDFFFFLFSVEDGFSEDGWWADATLNAIRKTKSAEHIGVKPTIIVNGVIGK